MNHRSKILIMTSRILFPICMVFSIHILLRGHQLPGGGFIAGLLTAATLGLQYVAFGTEYVHKHLPLPYQSLIPFGLALAFATGLGSFVFGKPFLTSYVYHAEHIPLIGHFEFATAVFFDLGVYFAVVGVTVGIFNQMGEQKPWN